MGEYLRRVVRAHRKRCLGPVPGLARPAASPPVAPERAHQAEREAALALANEALVDEGLERVEIGVRHLLRGLESAAARKHGKAREQPPFRLIEEVVAPLDRGP